LLVQFCRNIEALAYLKKRVFFRKNNLETLMNDHFEFPRHGRTSFHKFPSTSVVFEHERYPDLKLYWVLFCGASLIHRLCLVLLQIREFEQSFLWCRFLFPKHHQSLTKAPSQSKYKINNFFLKWQFDFSYHFILMVP